MATERCQNQLSLSDENAFVLDHVYADNDLYTAVVTVEDEDGGYRRSEIAVTVNNLAPTIVVDVDREILVGDTVTLTTTALSDLGVQDLHTATIDWGTAQTLQREQVESGGNS